MIYSNDRQEMREVFFKAWRKFQLNEPLEPIEKQIVNLIKEHPEYHEYLNQPEKYRDYNFDNDTQVDMNPFLHLGLHLTILEQVITNRPQGMTAIYKDMVEQFDDAHHAEHHIMEILADTLWQNMQNKKFPDEKAYIKQLKKLLKKGCAHHH